MNVVDAIFTHLDEAHLALAGIEWSDIEDMLETGKSWAEVVRIVHFLAGIDQEMDAPLSNISGTLADGTHWQSRTLELSDANYWAWRSESLGLENVVKHIVM